MQRVVVVLGLCAGCGANSVHGSGGDVGADLGGLPSDVSSAADVGDGLAIDVALDGGTPDAPDAPRCDPSILADAGGDDVAETSGGPYVVELAINSQMHQCARMSDGTVRCRGSNYSGALGLGFDDPRIHESAVVPGLTDVEQVVTSDHRSTCTRHRDGTVRCWGSNRWNMLGTGHSGDERCPSALDDPCRTRPTLVPGLTDVVHLAVGPFSVCAVRRDGSLWCWGNVGLPGRLGESPVPTPVPGITDAVSARAMLIGWIVRARGGRYELFDTPRIGAIPSDAEVLDGLYNSHVCYRLPDTSVRCLGLNADGKVGNGTSSYPAKVTEPWDPGLCGVRSIVTGASHTCAVLADRTVSCWGDGSYGGLGVEAGERCVGIIDAGACVTRPTPVRGIDHVERLFAGTLGTCALRTDRSLWCWGILGPYPWGATPVLSLW